MGEIGLDAAASGFFFGGMLGGELDADPGGGKELAADLELEIDADLGEELEVDEDGSSACAPVVVVNRQMP